LNKVDTCDRAKIDETKEAIRGINAFVPIRECSLAKDPAKVPIDELLAIEAFDAAKLLVDQASKDEVNLVVKDPTSDDCCADGHEGGGHGDGHEDGHGGGHGDGGHGDGGHGDGGHGDGHGSGHGGGHSGGGHGHGGGASKRHDTEVKSMVLEAQAIDMPKFHHFIGCILEERAQDLYRYKGVLAVKDPKNPAKAQLHILQGVHDMPELTFSGEWPEGKAVKTQVVLIGRKLDTAKYRKMFEECKATLG